MPLLSCVLLYSCCTTFRAQREDEMLKSKSSPQRSPFVGPAMGLHASDRYEMQHACVFYRNKSKPDSSILVGGLVARQTIQWRGSECKPRHPVWTLGRIP